MPLKIDHHAFNFSPFVFFDGFNEKIPLSFSGVYPALCRIARRFPVGIALDDEGLVLRKDDAGVVEFKHSAPTSVLVERPSLLTGLARFLKQKVPPLFSFGYAPKTVYFLRPVFQFFGVPASVNTNNCNGIGVHNHRLRVSFSCNKSVRTRNISKRVYIKYSTALPVGGL